MRPLSTLLPALRGVSMLPDSPATALPRVVFMATGGTIAMKIDPATGGIVPAITGDDLLLTIPDVATHAEIEVDNVANMSANYFNAEWWGTLTRRVQDTLDRPDVAGIVLAQGTDTMEETAWWLDLTVVSDKPVVMVGAQRNASAADFDGPRNLLNAIRIAVAPEARGKGVMVAMNQQINAARSVTKTHTGNVETFKSGDAGFLGEVWDDRVVFSRAPLRRMTVPVTATTFPKVDIFPMYGGADGTYIRYAVERGVAGIVVEAVGMGNMNVSMYEAVVHAIKRGVPVVITSRVPNGRVRPLYGFVGGGKTTFDAGAIPGGDLSAQKARLLLILLLQAGPQDTASLRAAFDR
ncbi:L-asparaginase [Pigmentiphaga litoralis]|uniref:L-asparaginase n=2 Tax=Pigmentiphaga litoralis TaxID=516702 RepID=A0A7Y9IW28_9BURK|nr:L-asparaginase [Pigmentiphaga litoralis]NYE84142.1 L-asparaginase [Pigmentiphaga litoralis]